MDLGIQKHLHRDDDVDDACSLMVTLTARGPFIYDPFSDKRHREKEAARPCQWVCGEMATVEVDVFNPASVGVKVDRLAVEAHHAQRPAAHPGASHLVVTLSEGTAWKPMPTSLRVPALTPAPTRLQLIGAPTAPGTLVLTGCRVSTFGVTWHQPWAPRAPTIGACALLVSQYNTL